MYKVFFNRKFVLLTTQIIDHNDETPFFYIKYSDQNQIISALKSKQKGVYLYHSKENKLWKHMLKIFSLVEAAGGLVEHQSGKVLFIFRNDKWDLPKGKVEKKNF